MFEMVSNVQLYSLAGRSQDANQSQTLALFDMAPFTPAPFPQHTPRCCLCDGPGSRYITRRSNRNGNIGRPYYKCLPCKKFLGFADDRGNDTRNPPCDCGESSKRQLAGKNKTRRGVHYACRLLSCDFYQPCVGGDGEQVTVDDDEIVRRLAGLRIL
jgi:hypothetical protein